MPTGAVRAAQLLGPSAESLVVSDCPDFRSERWLEVGCLGARFPTPTPCVWGTKQRGLTFLGKECVFCRFYRTYSRVNVPMAAVDGRTGRPLQSERCRQDNRRLAVAAFNELDYSGTHATPDYSGTRISPASTVKCRVHVTILHGRQSQSLVVPQAEAHHEL